MKSSTDLIIALEDEDDIDDIYEYTRGTWSERQANRYHDLIRDGFLRIQALPEIGRVASDQDPAIREYAVRQHVILYRHDPDAATVMILRVVNPHRIRR